VKRSPLRRWTRETSVVVPKDTHRSGVISLTREITGACAIRAPGCLRLTNTRFWRESAPAWVCSRSCRGEKSVRVRRPSIGRSRTTRSVHGSRTLIPCRPTQRERPSNLQVTRGLPRSWIQKLICPRGSSRVFRIGVFDFEGGREGARPSSALVPTSTNLAVLAGWRHSPGPGRKRSSRVRPWRRRSVTVTPPLSAFNSLAGCRPWRGTEPTAVRATVRYPNASGSPPCSPIATARGGALQQKCIRVDKLAGRKRNGGGSRRASFQSLQSLSMCSRRRRRYGWCMTAVEQCSQLARPQSCPSRSMV
jgi:hypothetical protein